MNAIRAGVIHGIIIINRDGWSEVLDRTARTGRQWVGWHDARAANASLGAHTSLKVQTAVKTRDACGRWEDLDGVARKLATGESLLEGRGCQRLDGGEGKEGKC